MFPFLLFIVLAAFAALAWRDLARALVVISILLPAYLVRFSVAGIPLTLLEVLILITVGVWIIQTTTKNQWSDVQHIFSRHWWLLIGGWLLAFLIAAVIAPDTRAALGVLKAYAIEPILLLIVIRSTFGHQIAPLLNGLGISAMAIALLGIIQWLTGLGIPIPWDIERRITSIFPFPNAIGLYLGPIVMIAIAHLTKKRTWFWMSVAVLSVVAIMLAKSEAALVAIVATTLLGGIIYKPTRRVAIAGTTVAVIAASLFGPLQEKLLLQDYSGQVRLSQWSETMELLKTTPVLGTGLSGYPQAIEPFHRATHYEIFQYPHNIILNIWTELGLLGLALLVATLWLVHLCAKGDCKNLIAIACLMALTHMLIHGLVDVPFFKNDLAVMTIILVAGIASYGTHKKTT